MRGDIHRLKAPSHPKGHEQRGERYAVIVQSDDLLTSTTLVAPTSRSVRPASYRPETRIDGTVTRIMVEQTAAVDPAARLGEWAGRLSQAELQAVDRALATVLGLA
ncbi:MAG: type II toxin-antitoxin system PemK/MazF family toxin [Bifidobacteriaceae bacterium]|jgi:mRNA interferase MazF|nr:type II toxin-antitoxin system PemK/MazF family toxin [Bifidobacteriaceae bacterium]